MKNILLTTALLITASISSFAENNGNQKMLKELSAALRKSEQIAWCNKAEFRQATFKYNDKVVNAFYTLDDNELIGYGIYLSKEEVPEMIKTAIKNKYGGKEYSNIMMLIDSAGLINYYIETNINKTNVVVRITSQGKASVYKKLQYN